MKSTLRYTRLAYDSYLLEVVDIVQVRLFKQVNFLDLEFGTACSEERRDVSQVGVLGRHDRGVKKLTIHTQLAMTT